MYYTFGLAIELVLLLAFVFRFGSAKLRSIA
jgi:hypothetical protein